MSKQLSFPKLKPKQSLTVQIETELLQRVRFDCKQRCITLRQAVEYGLQAYLNAADEDKPKE